MAIRRFVVSSCRFVVLLWRFVVSARRFLKSTRRITSSIRRLVSFHRFVVSLCRFVVSTRPLREAIIRRTLHEVFTRFHALIHDVFNRNLLCAATEKGFSEELLTAQHIIRVKSSE